jgi:hypothetical protein
MLFGLCVVCALISECRADLVSQHLWCIKRYLNSSCDLRHVQGESAVHCTPILCSWCRQEEPEKIQQELEEFLKSHGVDFSYSGRTKFANFRHRTLL